MGYKVYIAILLWRLGLRKILPSVYVNKKPTVECGSKLIDISGDPDFSFEETALQRGGLWVRAELVPMLKTAARNLPDGVKLHFFGGWRHIAVQWTAWNKNLVLQRERHPDMPDAEIRRIARMTSADPSRGGYGPHQTGGAIDVTLVRDGGDKLDMGTPFDWHGIESRTDYKLISDTQRKNRNMLRHALESAGFINYPGEWWHYSYGDRAWATYGHKKCAIYGRIPNPDYKLKKAELEFADK